MTPREPPKPTPKLGEPQVRKPRARKPSLDRELEKAQRAGQPANAAEIYADHIKLMFGEDEKATVTPLQAWKAKKNAR